MSFDMSGKTADYWVWIKNMIDNMVKAVKEFYAVISGFVGGFKNELTVNPEDEGDVDPMY